MAKRKRQTNASASTEAPALPWYKRAWVILSFVGAALYGLLMYGPTMLSNAQTLPAEFEKTKNKFLTWYYDDEAWSGMWSSAPEGYVDIEDMRLSSTDVRIIIDAKQGTIGGVIAAKAICQTLPLFDYVLIEGKVSGTKANLLAFDMIGGSRRNLAKFNLTRDGVVLTVVPSEGAKAWLPQPVRIGLHPDETSDAAYKSLSGFCNTERDALKQLRQEKP